jgi:hypothetical protein
MRQLYFLDEQEKNRILNLHESATKRQYLGEQQTGAKFIYNNPNDKEYDYKMENGKYYFKGKEGTTNKKAQKYKDWYEAKAPGGITAIKALFDAGTNVTTTEIKPATNTDPSKAAQVTASVAQTGTPATGTPATGAPATGAPTGTQQPGATSGVVTLKVTDAIVSPQASTASTTNPKQDPGATNTFSSNPANKIPEFKGYTPKPA